MKKIFKKLFKASTLGIIMAVVFVASYVFASIPLGSNFQLNSQLPLDARTVVVDLTSRDAIPAGQRYEGLNVYVISNTTNYQLQGGILNANWTVAGGGGGADPLGTYITQTATNAPANAQVLGSLGTGILKSTTTTGLLSIAVAGDFPILNQSTTGTAANIAGGLGGQILYQSAVDTTAKLANGTAGQVLTSQGTILAPSWTTPSITTINSTNLFSTGLFNTGSGVTATDYSNFFGVNAGNSATAASGSNFFGLQAGFHATSAYDGNFFGILAGASASGANDSNFFGQNAGRDATSASNSNFFGNSTGQGASSATNSNFFGMNSGNLAVSASDSNFFGQNSGADATSASNSNFFGQNAGIGAVSASNSNFFGQYAGASALNASNSIFIGQKAGNADNVNNTASPDNWSILLGYNTNTGGFKNSVLLGGASSSTPIANTKVNQFMLAPSITELRWRGVDYTLPASQGTANTLLTNNGIGGLSWTAPALTVVNVSNLFSTGLVSTGNGVSSTTFSNFFGTGAGSSATSASNSNFFGHSAGTSATSASDSNFFGQNAGASATSATGSNFFGAGAGSGASSASNSNFFGGQSGDSASGANDSNFFGSSAGVTATSAANSNFFGNNAGAGATSASFSNFFGLGAGASAPAASNSNFFGQFAGGSSDNAANSNFFGFEAGAGADNAANSIFIGRQSGKNDTVNNTTAYNDTSTFADTSILIGHKTSTGNNKNSIALGAYAINTAANQFMIGSATRPINTTVWNGAGSVTCTFTTAVGAMTCASDINLKKNISTLDNKQFVLRNNIDVLSSDTLNKILTLTPVTYNWNYESNTDLTHMGFIAQEVEQVFPSLVTTNETTHLKSLNITGLTPYIVKAIQEMDLKISGINNLEVENSWRDSLVAWLGNAVNGINRIYTKEICVKKSDGTDFCANGDQLEAMTKNSVTSTFSSGFSNPTPNPSLPVVKMNGDDNIKLVVGDSYTDAGATASSTTDGDITSKINTVNNVDTSKEGTYTVTYNVADTAGNNALEVTRTVIVNAPTPPSNPEITP